MKCWELKFSVVVGDNWWDVVRVRILMNVSRYVYGVSSCFLFLVSAYARMKSVLCVNGPGAVPFRILRRARMVKSRSKGYIFVMLSDCLFLVVRVFLVVCCGYMRSDVGDGKLILDG